jgi:hypothetical protein
VNLGKGGEGSGGVEVRSLSKGVKILVTKN